MFELFYPGNCFGNIDVSAKECKKCKIKQFCGTSTPVSKDDVGTTLFRNLVMDRYVCEIEELEGKTSMKCFEKERLEPSMTIDFMWNGNLVINKGEEKETIAHIISSEKAETLFNRISCIDKEL